MLTQYLEIISHKDWENKYKKKVTYNTREYKAKTLPRLKELFTKLNGGTFSDTVVIDYQSKIVAKLNKYDKEVINMIIDLGYTVSKESYMAGKLLKNNKEINVLDVLNGFNSKVKTRHQMTQEYEKNPHPAIKKQLDAIEKLANADLLDLDVGGILFPKLSIYSNNMQGNYKLVFTMDPRAIASQSTNVGWVSCMNLDHGQFKDKVKTGIAAGMFVVYLTKTGDELTLDNPTARVAVKPLKSEDGKTIYAVDMIYGTAPKSFKTQVEKILEPFNVPEAGVEYNLDEKIYPDRVQQTIFGMSGAKKTAILNSIIMEPRKISRTDDEEIHLAAIKAVGGWIALYINKPSKNILLAAVSAKTKPMSLDGYKKLDDDIYLAAVTREGTQVRFIKNPSEEIQLAAVREDGLAIKAIKNPSDKVKLAAVINNGEAFRYIKNPSEEIQLAAVREDGLAIRAIKNPSDKVKLAAVINNGEAFRYIKNPSKEIQLVAVKSYPAMIARIDKPTEEMKLIAVQKNPKVIEYINRPSEELQKIAVTARPYVIKYIDNPTPAVVALAKKLNEKNNKGLI